MTLHTNTPLLASVTGNAPARPRIAVIGTGGTFAMHARHRFDWIEYADSGVMHPIAHLLTQLGELAPEVDLVPIPFRNLGSVAITPADWLALARLIRQTVANDPGVQGFVITHGTATLEETAWFLDLALDMPQPVVLTGAQRPINTSGSDAPANLRAAVMVAANSAAQGAGVVAVLDSTIFAARDVTKAASFELHAFEGGPYGPLGRVDADGSVVWRRRRCDSESRDAHPFLDKAIFTGAWDQPLPRVDIVMSYAGADHIVIDALVAAGTQGIISAGLPPGRPAAAETKAYAAAVHAGVTVVQATRSPRGMVPVQRFLQADGILAGSDLAPQKLRIALMLALTATRNPERLQRYLLGL